MSRAVLASACALALLYPSATPAATDAELQEIRQQLRDLKSQYESRIQALERRLQEAEARAPGAAPRAAAAPAVVPAQAPAVVPAQAPAVVPAQALAVVPAKAGTQPTASTLSAFNPALSAILTGTYANLSQDPAQFAIAGFAPRGEVGPPRRGFSLGESELVFTANVDPHFAGNLTVALAPENEVSVEEAYGLWLTAPLGLTPKFGRFLSGLGYQNELHPHAWDFVDAPLAYQAFFGGRYTTEGVQLKWLAPTEQFIELGAEAGNGDAFPGGERAKNGAGAGVLFAHVGGDLGESHSWRAGVSTLRTRSEEDERVRLAVADFVWKYAPGGSSRERNLKLQGEYFSGRTGELERRKGWYLQSVYQFMPGWRVGARVDRLDPGAAAEGFRPRKESAMLEYNPSEFSRIRLQYARSRTVPDVVDNQWFVQYVLSLGAHGAHRY